MRSLPLWILTVVLLWVFVSALPAGAYSDEATALFTRGNALVQEKNYTEAVSAFDEAIALEPGYYEALDRKADALNRAGKFSQALLASSDALAISPDYVTGWINRGQILYNIGYYYEDQLGDTKKADQYYAEQLLAFEKAVELDPDSPEAWFNKGYALAGLKRYDEAIAAFDKVESLDPDYPNLALSQKQAHVLRDASAPVYTKVALPVAAGVLIIILAGAGYFVYRTRSARAGPGAPESGNRITRRKKEN